MRINKYLSHCGAASRREADELLRQGKVTVNGLPAEFGMQVEPGDVVLLEGKRILPPKENTYLLFNKPVGLVCTSSDKEEANIFDYLKLPVRVTYAGRLDRASEGLLLLTDDGDLIQNMMAARFAHEKEYEVTVNRPLTESFQRQMSEGVYLKELNVTTRPCQVTACGECTFRIVLTQGLNRQIRRMCETLGYRVKTLRRIRIVNILLDDMKPGDLRELTEQEKKELFRQVMGEAFSG